MRPSLPPKRQGGAAIIAALLVTALATVLAVGLLRDVDDWLGAIGLRRDKAVSRELAHSAIDYARAILADDQQRTAVDTLDEPWNRVLPPISAENSEIRGQIVDQQGLWNLNNLLRDGVIDEEALAVYRQLLGNLGIPPETAGQLADSLGDWLDSDDSVRPGGAESAYYQSLPTPYPSANHSLDQLSNLRRIKGYTPGLIERLGAYATVLPGRQPINVNTAPAEVLQAVQPGLGRAAARQLVQMRQSAYFRDVADFRNRLPDKNLPEGGTTLSVISHFFLVQASAHTNPPAGARTRLSALLQRANGAPPTLLWMSQQ